MTNQWRIQKGGHGRPRSPRPKFAIAKVCRIHILHWDKNAKYYVQMCKKHQLLGDFVPGPDLCRSLTFGSHWGTSLAALSVNDAFCVSLRLCFSTTNDVCSAPNSWRTRNQRHGFMHGWMTLAKNLVPNLPLLFKKHKTWSVDSQESY